MPKYKQVMHEIADDNLLEWAHDVTMNLEEPPVYDSRRKVRTDHALRPSLPRHLARKPVKKPVK